MFQEWPDQLQRIAGLADDWDGYNSAKPSDLALANAARLLDALARASVTTERVAPTSDRSVLIRYRHAGRAVEWECFSDGANVRTERRDGEEPSYAEVKDIDCLNL